MNNLLTLHNKVGYYKHFRSHGIKILKSNTYSIYLSKDSQAIKRYNLTISRYLDTIIPGLVPHQKMPDPPEGRNIKRFSLWVYRFIIIPSSLTALRVSSTHTHTHTHSTITRTPQTHTYILAHTCLHTHTCTSHYKLHAKLHASIQVT